MELCCRCIKARDVTLIAVQDKEIKNYSYPAGGHTESYPARNPFPMISLELDISIKAVGSMVRI